MVEKWARDDVSDWLKWNNEAEICELFKLNHVDGIQLLDLTMGDMREDLGMDEARSARVLHAIQRLRTSNEQNFTTFIEAHKYYKSVAKLQPGLGHPFSFRCVVRHQGNVVSLPHGELGRTVPCCMFVVEDMSGTSIRLLMVDSVMKLFSSALKVGEVYDYFSGGAVVQQPIGIDLPPHFVTTSQWEINNAVDTLCVLVDKFDASIQLPSSVEQPRQVLQSAPPRQHSHNKPQNKSKRKSDSAKDDSNNDEDEPSTKRPRGFDDFDFFTDT